MIKKILIFVILLAVHTSLVKAQDVYMFSYFVGNGEGGLHLAYSYNGLKWETLNNNESFLKPALGRDSLMRDPFILKGPDSTFHLLWTTGWHDRYIGYASSKNLLQWSAQKLISVMEHEPDAQNCWAPEMFYDEPTKTFYIFWATTIPGRHSAVKQRPDGKERLNHRMYYVTTKDFRTFSETKMFFNPDFSVIDASVIKEADQFVMFLKNENPYPPEKNIRVSISKTSVLDFPVEVSEPITGDYWAEGPAPLKIGDFIYVYFDKYIEKQYGAVRSKDLKNWEDISAQISFPKGTRHGSAFKVSGHLFKAIKH